MILSDEFLKKMFKETVGETVRNIHHSKKSLVTIYGDEFNMKYNPLEGYIILTRSGWGELGIIFINDCSIFSEITTTGLFDYGHYVGVIGHKLKRLINSNQKRSRRKFISR